MVKHLFKLVWNRKRTNLLITVEIFFSFLVLFGVIVAIVFYADNYRQPLGFDYANVWSIEMRADESEEISAAGAETTRQLLRALHDLPEVEHAAGLSIPAFSMASWGTDAWYNGRSVQTKSNAVTDEFANTMGLRVSRGRWFNASDDAVTYDPIIINERLARELYGDDEPIGKPVRRLEAGGMTRVIGVVQDYRDHTELMPPGNYMFNRRSTAKLAGTTLRNLVVRVRPGTTAAFEEKMVRVLESIAKARSFRARPLAQARRSMLKMLLAPMIAASVVAGFLILMVGLGMVGVLWQNVSRRSSEIGLRRALGGTAGKMYMQVMGELMVVATIALALGTAFLIQLPLLEFVSWISSTVYIVALFISVVLIYGLTLTAGLYPSWMATRVQPAVVLRQE